MLLYVVAQGSGAQAALHETCTACSGSPKTQRRTERKQTQCSSEAHVLECAASGAFVRFPYCAVYDVCLPQLSFHIHLWGNYVQSGTCMHTNKSGTTSSVAYTHPVLSQLACQVRLLNKFFFKLSSLAHLSRMLERVHTCSCCFCRYSVRTFACAGGYAGFKSKLILYSKPGCCLCDGLKVSCCNFLA